MRRSLAAWMVLLGCVFGPGWVARCALAIDQRGGQDSKQASSDEDKDEEKDTDDEAKDADKGEDDADTNDEDSAAAKDDDVKENDSDEAKAKDDKPAADAKKSTGKDAESKSDEKSSAKSDDAAGSKDPEKKDDAKPAEKKKPEIHKVETKDLKVEIEVDGVFVADDMDEVALRPKVWSSFKVKEAVAHGTAVRKGDVLVKFDDEDIEKAIATEGLEERLGEVALMQAEEEFPRREKTIELEYQLAKRNYDQDVDEYDRFHKTMRDLSEKMADYYLKSAEQELDNAQEELDQLQKMYEADEITEETEEIVLRRQKFQVEMAEFYVKYSKINHDYTLNISIPRREEMLSTAVEQSKLAYDQAKMVKSLGLSSERYALEALRERRARAVEKHGELVADRALMTLRAPSDGLAYYGRQIDGRWMEVGSMESKLVPFGSVTPNSIVMTIVKERPMYVQTSVGEKDYPTVKAGQPATIKPVAESDVELRGSVKTLSDVPGSGNKFNVKIALNGSDEGPEWLKPGMTGKVKVLTYEAKDAVVIPADLVHTDDEDEKQKYVMLQVKDEEKPVRRNVKLGKTKGKDVEVLKGLKAGDEIVKGAKDNADDKAQDEAKDDKSE